MSMVLGFVGYVAGAGSNFNFNTLLNSATPTPIEQALFRKGEEAGGGGREQTRRLLEDAHQGAGGGAGSPGEDRGG